MHLCIINLFSQIKVAKNRTEHTTQTTPQQTWVQHLAVLVDVILEIVILAQNRLGNEVLVVDADRGHEWSVARFSEPGDLSGLFIVSVLQVQTTI